MKAEDVQVGKYYYWSRRLRDGQHKSNDPVEWKVWCSKCIAKSDRGAIFVTSVIEYDGVLSEAPPPWWTNLDWLWQVLSNCCSIGFCVWVIYKLYHLPI